jgi:hypothetical protein
VILYGTATFARMWRTRPWAGCRAAVPRGSERTVEMEILVQILVQIQIQTFNRTQATSVCTK